MILFSFVVIAVKLVASLVRSCDEIWWLIQNLGDVCTRSMIGVRKKSILGLSSSSKFRRQLRCGKGT